MKYPNLAAMLHLAASGVGLAQANPDFEKDIRPVLQSKCFSCHNASKDQSGLALPLTHK